MMMNGRSPICFSTTAILSLSIILMMMTTMVKECAGWMTPCNGSTTAECNHVFEIDEELEFLMDTEVHRWILKETKNSGDIYGSLEKHNPACGKSCSGKEVYDIGRKCTANYNCKEQ
uniref:Uncharacterized protein n=1 Tax=Lactuca sativa TaxID=4236 RepID=A0A9R1VM42_LACSA|nr:hypothetical protein LSAT_V11C400222560 [Lactuca sativa]